MQSNICMKTTWTLPDFFFGICRHWSRWTLAVTPSWSRLWTCMCHSVAISWLAQCFCCIWMAGKLWGQGFQFPMRRPVLDVSIMGTVSLEPPTTTAGNLSWSSGVEVPWILDWECSPPTCPRTKCRKAIRLSWWFWAFWIAWGVSPWQRVRWTMSCTLSWTGQSI